MPPSLFLFSALFGSLFAAESPKTSKVTPLMMQNFQAIVDLQPYVANPEEFRADKNADEIEKNLQALVKVGKTLPDMIANEKPGLAAISRLFADYIVGAERNFKSGQRDFARHQVRTITNYCMACHTSNDSGLRLLKIQDLPALQSMSAYNKADFYAATQQFDQALQNYERVVFEDVSSEQSFVDTVHAIRNYLSISVRVKKDPKLTYDFIHKVSQSPNVSRLFDREIGQWKKDATEWMSEKKVNTPSLSARELLARSTALVAKARKHQLFPADHTGDVNLLRATNYAHEALNQTTTAQQRAEAFQLLGSAYTVLSDAFLWELDGLYLEACIHEVPHTPLARRCFKQLSSSVYLGFTGSRGVDVPETDLERLARLRKLSE
jgi:tetratricopeptide (TPR) repeat protein